MLTIGIDAHKRVHVAVALDENGQEAGVWRGPNSRAGWAELLAWAPGRSEGRQFGIEGAWGYGRGLAQHLPDSNYTWISVRSRAFWAT